MMNSQPTRVLRQLIEQYGPQLAEDPRRTEALLNDLCGQHRREIFVLVNAQRQNVPAELLSAPAWMPHTAVWSRLSRRLQEKLALAEDAADWAVESWAEALSLTDRPAGVTQRLFTRPWAAHPAARSTGRQSGSSVVESEATEQASSHLREPGESPVRKQPRSTGPAGVESRAHTYVWIAGAALTVLLLWMAVDGAATLGAPVRLLAGPQRWLMAVRSDPADHLQRAYSLPRMAWVSEGPLLVRSGPSTEDDSLAMLEAGASVMVTAFSRDAQWSQISQPVEGWVSNRFLNFLAPGGVPLAVRVGVEALAASADQTLVLEAPDVASAVVGSLATNSAVTSVAATVDGQWRHIIRPVSGWVASANLRILSE